MADITAEVCDAQLSFVEANVAYFVEVVGQFCPWTARLGEVEDFR
jgi:hypothetical protein